jgi:hypothetical protein
VGGLPFLVELIRTLILLWSIRFAYDHYTYEHFLSRVNALSFGALFDVFLVVPFTHPAERFVQAGP